MSRVTTKATCPFCQGMFGKAGMTKHLAACKARAAAIEAESQQKSRRGRLFHLVVAGRHAPMYWMHLEVPADAHLTDLDSFLRETWVECCGHLSAFQIAGVSYDSMDAIEWGSGDKPMDGVKLGKVLGVGQQGIYEYDFGTTTELSLSVVAERTGPVGGKTITVLARNEPPAIPCQNCGQPATEVCTECVWDGTGWICDACVATHACGDEMLLPVVNSPRVGMCGYSG